MIKFAATSNLGPTPILKKSSIGNEAIGAIVGCGALLVLLLAAVVTRRLCKESPPAMEGDDNPT